MKDEFSIQMQSAHGSVPMRFIPGVYSAGRYAIPKSSSSGASLRSIS